MFNLFIMSDQSTCFYVKYIFISKSTLVVNTIASYFHFPYHLSSFKIHHVGLLLFLLGTVAPARCWFLYNCCIGPILLANWFLFSSIVSFHKLLIYVVWIYIFFFWQATIFHYGSISLIKEPCKSAHIAAAKAAKEAGVVLSYDPNLRLPLWPSSESAREGILSIWDTADIIKVVILLKQMI